MPKQVFRLVQASAQACSSKGSRLYKLVVLLYYCLGFGLCNLSCLLNHALMVVMVMMVVMMIIIGADNMFPVILLPELEEEENAQARANDNVYPSNARAS